MNISPEKLLQALTLDQKLAQLIAHGSPSDFVKNNHFDRELAKQKYPNGLFGLMVPIDLSPCEIGEWVCEMRDCFEELSPIPPIVMCESLHGILGKGTTVFPQSIGMGASFDPALMKRVGEAIGKEARALGIRMSLAPDLDLGRDPRWGRIEETFGEAPFLVSKMGEAYIQGLLAEDGRYAATVKHFAAHGSPEAGINLAPVNVTAQELFDKYLPPFQSALDAGARCVMPAYSSLNGIPCHANPFLMQDILREKWGFDGVVISDFDGISMLATFQHMAENKEASGLLALSVGVDVEAPFAWGYGDHLKTMIAEGKLSMETIDRAVLRILQLKVEIGLFDLPKPNAEEIQRTVRSSEHRTLAEEAAKKSIVLMKNDGVLPLKDGAKIAVIGPNAFSVQLGDYALPKFDVKTPLEAIRERAEQAGGSVLSAKGCDVYGSDVSGLDDAEALAKDADAVVCIIGGKSMKGYGVGWGSEEESILTCGEGCDMHDLTPGGPQLDLVRRLISTGKPVVVVMIDGRPETLFDVAEQCNALIAAWYPGEEGSTALASLLFGDTNFSAKLPVTFPRHVGQLPICHDRVPSAGGFYHKPGTMNVPGRDYVFSHTDPAFAFGHGMGYSDIIYRSLEAKRCHNGLRIAVEVENKGKYFAEEPILVFLRDEVASLPQPMKKLIAFRRVALDAGMTAKAEFHIPDDALMFTNGAMQRTMECGWFIVMVGDLCVRIYRESPH
ncbi:MAG: glycoside hydrolase family 3 C-terminal domain-containing protein [Clostridia bacterium]|nr:glycoside hydrolase family 3 C-terminal domain-containing protein [Clostridia bacterium]